MYQGVHHLLSHLIGSKVINPQNNDRCFQSALAITQHQKGIRNAEKSINDNYHDYHFMRNKSSIDELISLKFLLEFSKRGNP